MKICKLKFCGLACLAAILISTLFAGIASITAFADEGAEYNESYRNQLAFSAARGWNNDPNGLLYVNGTYHMYYQYNWDKKTGATANDWGYMSWGHATSSDLVHWEERAVAIPAVPTGKYDGEGKEIYDMMFSGSAVYDGNNTSGLFNIDESTGMVTEGHGIVAILTQPNDDAGGQRQILAYSKDGGDSFEIYGEIIGAKNDGGVGDGEFRDPKVFWHEKLGKWLMAVGGGSVRMYSSDNLLDWKFIGKTGYWGECPDISRYEVDGEEKYVLIISPEDKAKSHEYNRTTRAETYYPAEYYVVGDIDENGLFVSNEPLKRLSEGIDSYAFQSFNNPPDGKVYGVSWAASWKSVGEYGKFRKNYNGGMTVACELNLVKEDGGYALKRTPVKAYEELRGDTVKEYSGRLAAGENALAGVRADVAEVEAELDFTGSGATYAELNLRVSAAERITLRYDVASALLTLDRGESSLLAEKTALYTVKYTKTVPLENSRLSLKILLDRAFISVFANGGSASCFSAVFPSAISNAMQLTADGEIGVNAKVYSLNGIFGVAEAVDELILTTDKIDATVGGVYPVIASSFSNKSGADNVTFTVTEGSGCVKVDYLSGVAMVRAIKQGNAKISVSYGAVTRQIEVYVYENGFVSNVIYNSGLGGFSYVSNDGLRFETGVSDAFLFGNAAGGDFIYTAGFTSKETGSQAGGLVFGLSGNLTDYWVATADIKDNKVKLWRSGIGDLKAVDYDFGHAASVKLTLAVNGGVAKIFINGEKCPALTHVLTDYKGGAVGLNVYNAKMVVNDVLFKNIVAGENNFDFGGYPIIKVVNVTDGCHRLESGDYSFENGVLKINGDYLSRLENDTEYTFRVVTALTDFDVTVKTDFTPSTVTPVLNGYKRNEALTLNISGGAAVYRVEIDGEECGFDCNGNLITVAKGKLANLMAGTHTVKVYTSQGRPQTEFSIVTESDFRDEDIEAVTYTFLYIDVTVFAGAAIAFAVVSIILKRKTK